MGTTDVERVLRDFLSDFTKEADIGFQDNFMEAGFVNSLFSMQLIMFLEQAFHVTVETDDLTPENFDSLEHLTYFLRSKGVEGVSL